MRMLVLACVAALGGCAATPVVCPPIPAPPASLLTIPPPLPPVPADLPRR